MRFLFLIIFAFCLQMPLSAQEITGRAFYTSMLKFDDPKFDEKQLQDSRTQALSEQLKNGFQDEYQLEFTQEESLFKKMPKLDKPDPKKGGMSISMSVMSDEEVLYKNLSKNTFINETQIFGRPFLIQDNIEKNDWQLGKESKTIGDYVCFKATYLPTSDNAEDKLENKKPKQEIIAWYTPQIPIKNGPNKYDGLPSLILEIQDDNLIFLCTKIILNPQEAIVIKQPTRGEKVSQNKFDAIMEKKNEEMMENFKTKKRRN